jgi:hypothetical protein
MGRTIALESIEPTTDHLCNEVVVIDLLAGERADHKDHSHETTK